MGTIRKIGKNYQVDACRKGVRIRKIVGPSKRLAKEVLAEIEGKLVRGEFGLDRNDSSINLVFDRFRKYAAANLATASAKRYDNVIDRFEEFLKTSSGLKRTSQLNPGIIEKFRQHRQSSARPPKIKSMNFEIKALRTIFNYAVRWELMDGNPTQGVKTYRVTDARPLRFLSEAEVTRLLDASPDDMRSIILAFLLTGMRRGELEHLTWNDVDLTRDVIRIQHKPDWKPKTYEREIPIGPDLSDLLTRLKKNRNIDHPYVFTLEGRPCFEGAVRKRLITIAKRAGVEGLTSIHSLRHTFGSMLTQSGVPLPVVRELMGHSDVRTTMIYVHMTGDDHRKAIGKLDFSKGKRS